MAFTFYLLDIETKIRLLENGLFTHQEDLLLYSLFHGQLLLYLLFSARKVFQFHNKLKREIHEVTKHKQSWIIFVLIGFFMVWLLDVSFQTMQRVFDKSPYIILNIIYPFIFILVFVIMLKGINNPMIFVNQPSFLRKKYFGSNLKPDEKKLMYKSILLVMNNKKLYRNPSLSINDLAEELSVLPKHLSQVINEYFNKNFFDLINDYRIRDAKVQLVNSMVTKKTVLEILYDIGFNSKSSFNKAFRKNTGITPTEYRKNAYSKTA
ncbi:helix-turn-helix domain-containing protein [Bacteroidota bacterium]